MPRSRSRSPPQRNRSRSRSPHRRSRSRDRIGNDRAYYRTDRGRDAARDSTDKYGRRSGGEASRDKYRDSEADRARVVPSKAHGKAAIEQVKRERLEMVKRLTQGDTEGNNSGSSSRPMKSSDISSDKCVDRADSECGEEEPDMMSLLGFAGFDTTKNKHVEDNVDGAVSKNKKRAYRQYMNRRGGFNRMLPKT